MCMVVSAATPTITGVTAQQRYPWDGKVDISYTVTGDIAAEAKQRGVFTSLKVVAIDEMANTTNIATKLSGDTSLKAGTHAIVWDMSEEGLTLKSSNVVFTVSCETTPALYCVIDLSSGSSASSYPVTYLSEPPSGGFNVDVYKTTKLVLRRIEPGPIPTRDARITKPFFCGIFEVTQKQYELIMGSASPYMAGDLRPMDNMTYTIIRGSSDGAKWPSSSKVDASSIMGKLRSRTGLSLDLPTSAQWEYACRAGTTTKYSYGDSADGAYMNAYTSASRNVGSKKPNPWGLYDMHGNVWELCLDWYGGSLVGNDPIGPSSGSYRVVCGGSWASHEESCSSSSKYMANDPYSVASSAIIGFRICRTLPQ